MRYWCAGPSGLGFDSLNHPSKFTQILTIGGEDMKRMYTSLNVAVGCKEKGFSTGCMHCVAVKCAHLQSHRKDGAKQTPIYKAVLKYVDGKPYWNNKVIFNKHWDYPIKYGKGKIKPKPRKFLASYNGEIALLSDKELSKACNELLMSAQKGHMHSFTILTKIPGRIVKFIESTVSELKNAEIDVSSLSNVIIATSVETDAEKFRIDQLRKCKYFQTEVWFKPLLSKISNPNFRNIDSIRINVEKGNEKRTCKSSWIYDLIKNAKKTKTKTHLDMDLGDLKNIKGVHKKIKNKIMKVYS